MRLGRHMTIPCPVRTDDFNTYFKTSFEKSDQVDQGEKKYYPIFYASKIRFLIIFSLFQYLHFFFIFSYFEISSKLTSSHDHHIIILLILFIKSLEITIIIFGLQLLNLCSRKRKNQKFGVKKGKSDNTFFGQSKQKIKIKFPQNFK